MFSAKPYRHNDQHSLHFNALLMDKQPTNIEASTDGRDAARNSGPSTTTSLGYNVTAKGWAKRRPVTTVRVEPEDESCSVCFSGVTYENTQNEIIFCDGCDSCFHQQCYGIKTIPEGDWFCDQCKYKCDPNETCAICKQLGSGMKLSEDGTQWAHLSCVLEIGEVFFKDVEGASKISGIANVKKVRNTLSCSLCKQRSGAKIQCMAPHCLKSFHPRCGLKVAGKHIDADNQEVMLNDVVAKCVDVATDEDGKEVTWWSWYCNKHLRMRHAGELKISEPKEIKGRRLKEKRDAERAQKAIEREHREAERAAEKAKRAAIRAKIARERAKEKKRRQKEIFARRERKRQEILRNVEIMRSIEGKHANIISSGDNLAFDGDDDFVDAYRDETESYDKRRSAKTKRKQKQSKSNPGVEKCGFPDCSRRGDVSGFCKHHFKEAREFGFLSSDDDVPETEGPASANKKLEMGLANAGNIIKTTTKRNEESNAGFIESKDKGKSNHIVNDTAVENAPMIEPGPEPEYDDDSDYSREHYSEDEMNSDEDRALEFDPEETWKNTMDPKNKNDKICTGRFWHLIRDHFKPVAKTDLKYVNRRANEVEISYLENGDSSSIITGEKNGVGEASFLPNNGCRNTEIIASHKTHGFTLEKSLNILNGDENGANTVSVRIDTDGGIGACTYGQSSFHKEKLKLISFEQLAGIDGKDVIVADEEQKLTLQHKDLHQSIIFDFRRLQRRMEQAQTKGAPALRLGGEDELAPDGNLRYPGLASNLQLCSYPKVKGDFERKAKVFSLTREYKRLEAWRLVGEALQRGIVDRDEGFNLVEEDKLVLEKAAERGDSRAAEVLDEEDDAVCQVCFDGLATVSNEVLFCERCSMAIHQRCYGVPRIPDGDFFCDRCSYLNKRQKKKQEQLFNRTCCAICGKKEGALKRARGGRWVHLFCAQWTPKCIIHDPIHMTDIELPKNNYRRKAVCKLCGVACGHVISCSHPGCYEHYHAYCAWYAGYHMGATYNSKKQVNDDSTTFIQYKSYCLRHTPASSQSLDRVALQIKIRNKYQAVFPTETFVTDRKCSGKTRKKKTVDGVERLLEMQRALAEKRKSSSNLKPDIYVPNTCAVCFATGKVGDELLKCTVCSIEVHKACYLDVNTANSTFEVHKACYLDDFDDEDTECGNDWKCFACANFEQNNPSAAPNIGSVNSIKCELCPRVGGALSRTSKGKWVHTFCSSWIPGTQWFNKSCILQDIPKSHFGHRCCLCQQGGKRDGVDNSYACVQCAHPKCYRKFHPLCAKFANCYYYRKAIGDNAIELYSYCPAHWPSNLEFNKVEGLWQKKKSTRPLPKALKDLLAIRRDIDRSRTIMDVVRKRTKIERRIFDCEYELFEAQRTKYEPKNGPMSRRTRREQEEDKLKNKSNSRGNVTTNSGKGNNKGLSGNLKRINQDVSNKKRKHVEVGKRQLKSNLHANTSRMKDSPSRKKKKKKTVPPREPSTSQKPRPLTKIEKFNKIKKTLHNRSNSASFMKVDVDLDCIFKSIQAVRNYDGGDACMHFQTIPSEDEAPGYRDVVSQPISLSDIDGKIQTFKYSSWIKLTSDLKRMLSNAKKYNEAHSKVYEDAVILEKEVTNQIRKFQVSDAGYGTTKRSRSPKRSRGISGEPKRRVGGSSRRRKMLKCSNCDNKMDDLINVKPTEHHIMWYCKECLGDKNFCYMLLGREVHVFWPDDNAWYKAYIDCFHPDSHGHRILYYEDCNWEFLNFSDSLVCFTDFRKREA